MGLVDNKKVVPFEDTIFMLSEEQGIGTSKFFGNGIYFSSVIAVIWKCLLSPHPYIVLFSVRAKN
jgi:hypothetical protein